MNLPWTVSLLLALSTLGSSAPLQVESGREVTAPIARLNLIDWKCDEDNTPDQSCIKKYLECDICEGMCVSFCK